MFAFSNILWRFKGMANAEESIANIIDSLDLLSKPFTEYSLDSEINSIIKGKGIENIPGSWRAEAMAFQFVQDYQDQDTGWGTYYGPMFVLPNEDGRMVESPSFQLITPEILEYWEKRAREATHPILKVRYADLAWVFSKIKTGKQPHYSLAHIIIDNTIVVAEQQKHEHEVDVIKKLKRALSIAISINDATRLNKLAQCIIYFEDNIAQDKMRGLWGFSYDLLLKNKKVTLSSNDENKIISDLEKRLDRVTDANDKDKLDPWAAEAAAVRLAEYYRSKIQQSNIISALSKVGEAFNAIISDSSPLQASSWLQHLHSLYLQYGMREEAENIAIKLREIGPRVNDDMQSISQEFRVTHEEMDSYVNSIIDKDDIEKTLMRIAGHYVPQKDEVENQLKKLAIEAPLSYLVHKQIQDYQGRPVASIGSLEDDLDGNIVHLSTQNMTISSIFLREVIKRCIAEFQLTEQVLCDYLFKAPVFEDDKKPLINDGLKYYLEGNHLVASHLLIPQIENVIRLIVEKSGGSILKKSRSGGMHLKLLDELLRDERISNLFGENVALYFRILLTDQRGWNLRNDICHGIMPAAYFTSMITDRIFHILLCLAIVRIKK